ncbi:hypothetical protein [Sulfitobacter alexandrii]|nr:hypothetical protein [Sulfitobacter alexandrii]
MALVNYILAGMLGTVVAMALYQHRVSFEGGFVPRPHTEERRAG